MEPPLEPAFVDQAPRACERLFFRLEERPQLGDHDLLSRQPLPTVALSAPFRQSLPARDAVTEGLGEYGENLASVMARANAGVASLRSLSSAVRLDVWRPRRTGRREPLATSDDP